MIRTGRWSKFNKLPFLSPISLVFWFTPWHLPGLFQSISPSCTFWIKTNRSRHVKTTKIFSGYEPIESMKVTPKPRKLLRNVKHILHACGNILYILRNIFIFRPQLGLNHSPGYDTMNSHRKIANFAAQRRLNDARNAQRRWIVVFGGGVPWNSNTIWSQDVFYLSIVYTVHI